MNIIRKILKVCFVLVEMLFPWLVLVCLFYRSFISYGLDQSKGEFNIIMNSRPMEDLLYDPDFPDSLKYKILLVQEIRDFAIDSLGISETDNYTTVFDQKGKPVLWVLTACEPYSLKEKEWEFPFLGKVPYKGFFDKAKGEAEQRELDAAGLDTDFERVSAWSTLGWFQDPILSNMLSRPEGSLANLIIHELTHGTLYVKNNVDFNENLASFIGDKGAIRFLEYKYGKGSEKLERYLHRKDDEETYNKYIIACTAQLDSLYKTFSPGVTEEVKEQQKMTLINQIIVGVEELDLYDEERYMKITRDALKSKNAFFMAFKRYDSQQAIFEKEFEEKFDSDVRKYLIYLKGKYPSL
jgi:predicted aminopeptidase